jgi:hypothetical protein
MTKRKQSSGCLGVLMWPFVALWTLVATLIKLVGRVVAFGLGFVLMIVGLILTATVIGAVVGVPLAAFGFLLMIRSLF